MLAKLHDIYSIDVHTTKIMKVCITLVRILLDESGYSQYAVQSILYKLQRVSAKVVGILDSTSPQPANTIRGQ